MTATLADRLDSWKEIASFLRRDVRTVQRWEKKEGLPVYRHQHEKLGSVYAFPKELTDWLNTRQPAAAAAQQKTADKIKLAVLPFRNLGTEVEDQYFGDVLTDEMTAQITRLQPAQLAVIARTTAEHYEPSPASLRQMRQDLGVDYVLEGNVRRAGNRVRITARLSEVQDQTQLWAETYERDLRDVLSVQAEIAQAIAAEIHLALNLSERNRLSDLQRGQRPLQPAAFDAYLKARYHLHSMIPAEMHKSIRDFERAIELDPNYASAHAGLASALALLAIVPFDLLPPQEAMPKAEAAARRSLALDGGLFEAHLALALINHHYYWNWEAAEAGYRRAIELNPSFAASHLWYSWMLLALGKREEAFQEIERTMVIVQETDPHRLVGVHSTRAFAFYFAREFEKAVAECEKALRMDPDYFLAHYILGHTYMRLGDPAKAIAELQSARTLAGDMPLADGELGLAYAVSGQTALAKETAESFTAAARQRYIPPTYFVMIYAGLGDKDQAFAWLEKAFAERADGLTWLNVEPMLDGLRDDPRFHDLVRRIGLVH